MYLTPKTLLNEAFCIYLFQFTGVIFSASREDGTTPGPGHGRAPLLWGVSFPLMGANSLIVGWFSLTEKYDFVQSYRSCDF